MRPNEIRAYLTKAPFQPIRIFLSDGLFYDVRHALGHGGQSHGSGHRFASQRQPALRSGSLTAIRSTHPPDILKKQSVEVRLVSRLLKRLHVDGLIAKIPRSRRWRVTH